MRLLLFLLTCTLLGALALPARADLRCDRGIVRQGDRMAEVSLACGEPDVKVVLHSVLTAQAGFVPVEENGSTTSALSSSCVSCASRTDACRRW